MAAAVQRKAIEDELQLHIAGDATHGAHHIFDDVGAGQRAPQFRRKTEPAHCEDFIQSLEDAF